MNSAPAHHHTPSLPLAIVCVLLGSFCVSLSLQTLLETPETSAALMSAAVWQDTMQTMAVVIQQRPGGGAFADPPLGTITLLLSTISTILWFGGAWLIHRGTKCSLRKAIANWGLRGWRWWLLPGIWEILRLLTFSVGLDGVSARISSLPELWYSVTFGCWLAAGWSLASPAPRDNSPTTSTEDRRIPRLVWGSIAIFVVTLTAMNWQLYRGLLIPHGDSAMYEEHLWNVTHGKGFRSYLDQGLFLGEHIQMIHLLLVPLHAIWPSHMLLELCESMALAIAAVPIFRLAQRYGASRQASSLLCVVWLLAFPVHFLDISIDLKTFRPICFGVPLLLFAIDAFESGRTKTAAVLLVLTLIAKEDFALIIAPLGMYWAFFPARGGEHLHRSKSGLIVATATTVYLVLAVTVLIPAFREGANVHYARYFGDLGSTPGELAQSLFTRPSQFFARLFSFRSLVYAALLLLPVTMIAFRSLRLLVLVPQFAILCMMELEAGDGEQYLLPFHHFHAPLMVIIFWTAAGALASLSVERQKQTTQLAVCLALVAAGFYSYTPLGRKFWDYGTITHWRALYIPGPRAEAFPRVLLRIPQDARVASTDFAHTRFTHHDRSYDYSGYARRVSNYENCVPADTEFIVIDTSHRYSTMHTPEDVPEASDPEWELLPDETDGLFIVLRRR